MTIIENRRNFLKGSVALLLFGISEAEASSSKKLIVGGSKINDKYHVVRSRIDSGEADGNVEKKIDYGRKDNPRESSK